MGWGVVEDLCALFKEVIPIKEKLGVCLSCSKGLEQRDCKQPRQMPSSHMEIA